MQGLAPHLRDVGVGGGHKAAQQQHVHGDGVGDGRALDLDRHLLARRPQAPAVHLPQTRRVHRLRAQLAVHLGHLQRQPHAPTCSSTGSPIVHGRAGRLALRSPLEALAQLASGSENSEVLSSSPVQARWCGGPRATAAHSAGLMPDRSTSDTDRLGAGFRGPPTSRPSSWPMTSMAMGVGKGGSWSCSSPSSRRYTGGNRSGRELRACPTYAHGMMVC